MNLKLVRNRIDSTGTYGQLFSEQGELICLTLEHAYLFDHGWYPKVNDGTYICQRGDHILESGEEIETFEIMNVPNHTGILFHRGNTENNSSGCVLLGSRLSGNTLLNSTVAFNKFMALQDGVDQFTLLVEDDTLN
jgi:hypothetical protein